MAQPRPEDIIFKDHEDAALGVKKVAYGIDQYQQGAKAFTKGFLVSNRGKSSIIGKARENLFEFPCFISDTVPLEEATAVNTLLEQVYASYLQMAISTNPVISNEIIKRGGLPLSKYKTNVTKYIECTDLDFQHDACHAEFVDEESKLEFDMISVTDSEAGVILEAVDYQPLSEFGHFFTESDEDKKKKGRNNNRRSINNPADGRTDDPQDEKGRFLAVTRNIDANSAKTLAIAQEIIAKTKRLDAESEQEIDAAQKRLEKELEERSAKLKRTTDDNEARERIRAAEIEYERWIRSETLKKKKELAEAEEKAAMTEKARKKARAKIKAADDELATLTENREVRDTIEYKRLNNEMKKSAAELAKLVNDDTRAKQKSELDYEKALREKEKHNWDTRAHAPQMLDEGKINKINTMKPLMMTANFTVIDKYGELSRPVEYVLGVKTFCRVIDSQTLPEVVEYPMKEMNQITRKAKWRAGELKFMKDIVFHIKEKKQTAIDKRDPKRKWYRRLYELAHMKGDANAAHFVTGRKGEEGLIPNASIIISKADVDFIEDKTGIDLLNGKKASHFCQELFLMALVVVDLDAQSIKVLLPDISHEYEVQSMASVNKQIAMLDSASDKTREVFKMLNR